MPLIDEDGNLFGGINVIDALVIVMLLAVLVAGAALVTSTGDETGAESDTAGESETRYTTLDLGEQPEYVVAQLSEGDTAAIAGTGNNATVTDVHVTTPPADHTVEAEPTAMLRAEVSGTLVDDQYERDAFHVGEEPLRLGDELELDMGAHVTNGTVTALDSEDDTLGIESTTTVVDVELEAVESSVADELAEGMTETVRGETIATIESVEREPATVVIESEDGEIYEREHPQDEDVTLTVELQTTTTENGVQFRGERLGAGTSIGLDFETTTVDGTVTGIE